ncbi:hypothetical protein, partial [Aequoribacter sp.]|uniref:hypothetical protein n=1 Tax=Aequoribacter sp. TaxID=2847771 RepID=UPI003F6A1152
KCLTPRRHVSANFLRTAAGPSVARYARDVLSRDVPRETGCSRLAQSDATPHFRGEQLADLAQNSRLPRAR